MRNVIGIAACVLAATFAIRSHAEPLPADSGIVNVRDYGAKGNGRNDDTAALLRAIAASGGDTGPAFWQDRIVYLPDGTYRVSGTLLKRYADGKFASGLILAGQSMAGTVIRLEDNAPGFDDPRNPKAVIFTSSKLLDGAPTSGGKDYDTLGEGNDAYMNFVEDLTVDVGNGNPGAVGIDYLANNIGAIRDVTVRAPGNSGAVGIAMTRKWPGPALIQNVTIHGFDTGIAVAQTEYGLTLEHIRLEGQRGAAIRNDQNALSMQDLTVEGHAPAIVNTGPEGFIAIDGGHFHLTGNPGDIASAVQNAGIVVTRNLALDRSPQAGTVHLTGVLEGASRWRLTTEPAWLPQSADDPPPVRVPIAQWANVTHFGAIADPSMNSTGGLQRALDSGAAVVYLPHGIYAISGTIDVPISVRRIVGMNSTIRIVANRPPGFDRSSGMFRVPSTGPPVSIENLAFDNSYRGDQLAIDVSGSRDVLVRDVVAAGVMLLDRKPSGGRVFLEDVCCGRIQVAGPRAVLARQLDTEGGGVRITNLGSPVWVLGLKTEGVCTIVDNRDGARTDIFGGLIYMVHDSDGDAVPAFRNSRANLSASFAEESLRSGSRYSVYLADEAGVPLIRPSAFPARGFGRLVPDLTVGPDQSAHAVQ